MTKLSAWKIASAVFLLCAATPIASPAQNFSTLPAFRGTNGANPTVSLTQGADGNYYGLTVYDGEGTYHTQYDGGVFFRVTPKGKLTVLYNFCSNVNCIDGSLPDGGLVLATDGNFYGTTTGGGAHGYGTVFKMTPAGKLTTLYSFCSQVNCNDGIDPTGTLVQATDGNFYGTTEYWGPFGSALGGGTVFKITSTGKLTTLYGFCAQKFCSDGNGPESVGLVQATDGNFYGTTTKGGVNNFGTVFKITPGGAQTTIYSFCSQSDCNDGAAPRGSLLQASDGDFYGTTSQGGPNLMGNVYKITSGGTLTSLYVFCNLDPYCKDGAGPTAGLVQATDGNLYGTTTLGGANGGGGTLFKITPAGTLTTLHNFCAQTNCVDGDSPIGGLLQATDGALYGTTYYGGLTNCTDTPGCGTLFGLNIGLGPFVTFVRAAGKVGQTGGILGQSFIGTSAVLFGGIPASFTVRSDTLIEATVPPGATTGFVTVTTPSGVLTSNVPFRVLP